jgi:cell division protein FtsQ
MPRVKQKEVARPSRLKLLVRRQRRMLRPLGLGVFSFIVVMVGMFVVRSAETGGWAARLQKSLARGIDLRVQNIVINGRANTPDDQLRAALGVSVGDPILGFSVTGARDRIESLAWVQHVAVERRLPDTVEVDLVERRPFAIWQKDRKFLLIDRNGQVVTNEPVEKFSNLPLVVGTGAPPHAAELLDDLGKIPDISDRVAAAVRVGDRRWNLQLKNGITIMLPEDHEDIALAKLHELEQSQALLDRPLVFVDLRLPDRLTVRPKPTTMVVPDAARPPESSTRRAT